MTRTIGERLYGRSVRIYGTGCREFIGARLPSGYGKIGLNGKPVSAHRLSWELANGQEIPEGLFVLHACDNPPCIEPEHLRVGTPQDNMDDRSSRGRVNAATGLDNANGRKTHCPQGHDYETHGFVNNAGGRKCHPCRQAANRRAEDKRRGTRGNNGPRT